jgi:predicted O-methyltransferase YrrM
MTDAEISAERFVDQCILLLLGRDSDAATQAVGLRGYASDGECGAIKALAGLPEFTARTRRDAVKAKGDAWAPGHFHSPIPDAELVQRTYERVVRRLDRTLPGIDLDEDAQRDLVRRLGPFMHGIPWDDTPVKGVRYYGNNPYFPGGDALLLQALLRLRPPQRVVEIGSGFSSALMLDTDQVYLGSRTRFDFVEPFPERLRELLRDGDAGRAHIHETPVQDTPLDLCTSLQAGDVLFVDSSHVVKFGSDLLHILNEILPRLLSGVLVHFHDVFWPFEYPKHWYALGRAWNEAYALRHFLTFNSAFRIVCFADWLRLHEREFLAEHIPLLPHYDAGSLWLARVD